MPDAPMKVTDYLAIYGAGLSTLVVVWNMWRTRHRVAVDFVPSSGAEGIGYVVIVRNWSSIPVQIRNVGIAWQGDKVSAFTRIAHLCRYRRLRWVGWVHGSLPSDTEAGVPTVIAPGQSHMTFLSAAAVDQLKVRGAATRYSATVSDGLFRKYYSRPQPID